MKTTLPPHLAPLIEQMSRDMAVPVEGLVNQAIFNWARLHGYVEPSTGAQPSAPAPSTAANHAAAGPVPELKISKSEDRPRQVVTSEPVTSRVSVVDEPDARPTQASGLDWQVTSGGGTFGASEMADMTSPSIKRLRRLVLLIADRETVVNADRFVIGRDVSCNLTVEAPRISRQHVALISTPDMVELEDLNSSNGTWMNGERVSRIELQNGDEFFLGDVPVRIEFR
ncbi:MAG: FHA domain-containing protein [Archangium sp.]